MKTKKLHRNSQKRIHIPEASYFITGVTKHRFPYFEEEIFCETFAENLRLCQRFKNFDLHAWFLGYDHFHLLITPRGKWNISKIMQFLKRHTSRDINFLLDEYHEGEIRESRLRGGVYDGYQTAVDTHDKKLQLWKIRFYQKYPHRKKISFEIFRWQQSFHDHVIRDEQDFLNHMNYIAGNPLKHNMPEGWKWVFVEKDGMSLK